MHLVGPSWKQAPCVTAESVTAESSGLGDDGPAVCPWGWVPRPRGGCVAGCLLAWSACGHSSLPTGSLGSPATGEKSQWLWLGGRAGICLLLCPGPALGSPTVSLPSMTRKRPWQDSQAQRAENVGFGFRHTRTHVPSPCVFGQVASVSSSVKWREW